MADERDICERLEDTRIDGASYLRFNAAKEIRALRYYVARLEDDLVEEERQHGRTIVTLEKAREHIRKQALDIVTLGQEVGRLREALFQIAHQRYGSALNAIDNYNAIQAVARAALAEKEKK